jgi:hypothetical protein
MRCSDVLFVENGVVFASDLIRLTQFANECQLGIMKKCPVSAQFKVFVLLVTPLRIFECNAKDP